MKERPILLNADMVQAILDGRKTQTRRPVKFPINADPRYVTLTRMQDGFADGVRPVFGAPDEPNWFSVKSPFGTIGDRLWVRETFAPHDAAAIRQKDQTHLYYRADDPKVYESDCQWTHSIHMPRWASRITLEITAVRVERAQEISGSDVQAEGIQVPRCECEVCSQQASICRADEGVYVEAFRDLWQSIYANWAANPWVWVYQIRRIKP